MSNVCPACGAGHAGRIVDPQTKFAHSLQSSDGSARLGIALVDTTGDWMLHCHIPEHLEAGMMTFLSGNVLTEDD